MIHVLPFGARIHPDVHGIEFQRTARLARRRRRSLSGRCYEILLRLPVEHFLAVSRKGKTIDVFPDLFGLASFQVKHVQRHRFRRTGNGRNRRRFQEEQHARLAGLHRDVVPSGNGERNNPLPDAFEVDPNRSILLSLGGVFGFLLIRGDRLFFIALRRHRRGLILREYGQIHAACDRALNARHVEPAAAQGCIGARREVEILALFIEVRVSGVAHAIGHLEGLVLLQRIDEDRMQMTLKLPGVRDPFAVRRPGRIHRYRPRIDIRIDAHRCTFVQIHIADLESVVDVSDLLVVRRPVGRIREHRWISEADPLRIAQTALIPDLQRVLARCIRKISNGFSVR